ISGFDDDILLADGRHRHARWGKPNELDLGRLRGADELPGGQRLSSTWHHRNDTEGREESEMAEIACADPTHSGAPGYRSRTWFSNRVRPPSREAQTRSRLGRPANGA